MESVRSEQRTTSIRQVQISLSKRPSQKVSNLAAPKSEGREKSRMFPIRRPNTKILLCLGPHLDPRKTRQTFRNITAQGQKEKHCGSGFWIAYVHKTGRAAAEQKKPECSLGLSMPEKPKEMWEEQENKQTCNLALCGHGVTGAGATEAHRISFS